MHILKNHEPVKAVLAPAIPVHHGPPAKLLEELPERREADLLESVEVHAGLVLVPRLGEDAGLALGGVGLEDVAELLVELVVDHGELRAGGAVVGDADLKIEINRKVLHLIEGMGGKRFIPYS